MQLRKERERPLEQVLQEERKQSNEQKRLKALLLADIDAYEAKRGEL